MSQPLAKRVGNIFTYTWQEEGIQVRFDHIHQHNSGQVSGEITAKAHRPGANGLIHHAHLSNLLGTRLRQDTIKACDEAIPALPWRSIVTIAIERTLEQLRTGRPPIVLIDEPLSEASDWRLYPILYEKAPTVLFGKGGSLKSMLTTWISYRIAHGIDCEQGNVLILDWESEPRDWRRRLSMIDRGYEPDYGEPVNLFYRYCSSPLPDEIEEVQEMVVDLGIDLVVVDSAAYACGGEPEKAESTMNYFRALHQLEVTSLTIAHQTQDDETKRPFGSVYWQNSPRSTIQMLRSSEESDNIVEVALYQRKRNHGGNWRPLGFRATFEVTTDRHYTEGDRVEIDPMSITDMTSNPELAKGIPITRRVTEALKAGRMNLTDLMVALPDINQDSLRTTVYRMAKQDKIVQLANYTFGLPDHSFSGNENGASISL